MPTGILAQEQNIKLYQKICLIFWGGLQNNNIVRVGKTFPFKTSTEIGTLLWNMHCTIKLY